MKLISRLLTPSLAALAVLGVVACQKDVPRSERFVRSEGGVLSAEAGATLLVEKFTGQKCVNCPSGAKLLHKLEGQYPNRMITVAHHAASSRLTLPELESEASELYAKTFVSGSLNLPGVILSRRKVFDGRLYSFSRGVWAGQIEQALRIPRSYRIELSSSALDQRVVQIQTEVKAVGTSARSLMLQLWVVEDTWGYQTGQGGSDNYHHEHVMRGFLNGAWGEVVSALPYSETASYTLPESVQDLRHTKIVAFVYDAETKEVLEAAISPITGVGA